MRSIRVLFFACLLAVPLLISCSSSDDEKTYVVSAEDNGQAVNLKIGDKLEVVLQGNPTTGYEWVTTSVDSSVLIPGDSSFTPESDATGAGGEYVFKYTGAALGTTVLRLAYQRSWEGRPTQTFYVTVNVK